MSKLRYNHYLLHAIFIFAVLLAHNPEVFANPYFDQTSTAGRVNSHTYSSSRICSNCHLHLFRQFEQSMHAKAFINPVFQSQVYDVMLPQMKGDPKAMRKAGACLACHSPTVYLTQKQTLPARNRLDDRTPGVTCDFCHTVIGHTGSEPGNANYISSPGSIKYGPFKYTSNWHRKYSPYHRKSEACAVCHEATNEHGIQTHTTYSEWKTSSWAKKGIECQDCHMSASGRLIDGKAIFEKGVVAAAKYISPPKREKLFSHRFPGANVSTQIEGAVKLRVFNLTVRASPGKTIFIGVELDNSEAGHSMPTGAIELRLAWLDVRIKMKNSKQSWQLKAEPVSDDSWDMAGKSQTDTTLLGNEIEMGSRLYRAVLLDSDGRQTLNNWEAVTKVFDNRLGAGEIRREMYRFALPENAAGNLEVKATLRYLRYPPAFVARHGMAPSKSVLVAKVSKNIDISQ